MQNVTLVLYEYNDELQMMQRKQILLKENVIRRDVKFRIITYREKSNYCVKFLSKDELSILFVKLSYTLCLLIFRFLHRIVGYKAKKFERIIGH